MFFSIHVMATGSHLFFKRLLVYIEFNMPGPISDLVACLQGILIFRIGYNKHPLWNIVVFNYHLVFHGNVSFISKIIYF
jgi:hypothetical protein